MAVKRDVATDIYVIGRPEALVHANAATLDRQTQRLRQLQVGLDPDGDQRQVRLFSRAVRERDSGHTVAARMPDVDSGVGAQVDAFIAMDPGVDLADLAAKRSLEGDRQSLDNQHVFSKLPRRGRHLGANEPGSDQQKAFGTAERVANRLAVPKRAERDHVRGVGNAGQAPRCPTEAQHENVEGNLPSARQHELAFFHRAARHALVELELDVFLGIVSFLMQEDLRCLDLAAHELLGEVWPVVRPVEVCAEDRDVAVESFLAQGKGRRVASPAATDDHHTPLRISRPPESSQPSDDTLA